MQDSSSKTPCRRVGLRRIPSASSKSEPRSTPSFSSGNETPKSGCCLKTNKKERLASKCFSEGFQAPANLESPLSNRITTADNVCCTDPPSQSKQCAGEEALRLISVKKIKVALADQAHADNQPTVENLNSLRRRVVQKEKQLQELHQAQVICKKHDPAELRHAIQKWRSGCQEALQDLLTILVSKGHQIEMIQLIQELGIPSALVNFNEDTEEFV